MDVNKGANSQGVRSLGQDPQPAAADGNKGSPKVELRELRVELGSSGLSGPSGPDVSMLPPSVFKKTEIPMPSAARDLDPSGSESEASDGESQAECRSWWAQFFRLRCLQTPGAASLCVSLARMGLQDADLPSVTASLDRLLEDLRGERLDALAESSENLHRPPVRVLLEVDFSDNGISDSGAAFLFRWLLRRRKEVRCRIIRLARNKLGDASLEWLAALICAQHSAIEEMHLAQNAITASGAAQLTHLVGIYT